MLVTVIVPIYNVEKYINKCVDSIINQTYSNLQIILVNDGSTDNCEDICNQYSKMDGRIQVINKKNGGLSDSRNVGIEASKGKYILFIDGDDYIELDSVERLVNEAEKNELDILSANALKITKNKTEKLVNLGIQKEKIITGEEYMAYCIAHGDFSAAVCIRLYRTDLIKKNQVYFVKDLLHEDENWTPKILLKTKRIMYSDYCFYNYVIRENSITQSINKEKNILSILKTCKELEELYNSTSILEKNRKLFLDYLARLYMATSVLGKYDKEFYLSHFDKKFVARNTFMKQTRLKSIIFKFSIPLYRFIKLRLI